MYSTFFISGLLSPPSSPAKRRMSLPTSSMHSRTPSDASSQFYFAASARNSDYSAFGVDARLSFGAVSADSVILPDSPTVLPAPSPRMLPSAKPVPLTSLPSIPGSRGVDHLQILEASLSRSVTPMQRKSSVASQATRASATSSTVSTHYRRTRRVRALERLEGRRPPASAPPTQPKFEVTGNFISLSDDDDDLNYDHHTPQKPTTFADDEIDLSLTNEQLEMLIDNPYYVPPTTEAMVPPKRARRKTVLGLQSFMDFHNEDDTNPRWSWRSFIEIGA
uniref:Uncharacterized protein n=1 Tax=Mycena chlorophos TaxID=658473 RepID=A0ABQ0LKV0_MYCCL|nr:predicted protein [Mycena chlorophos]